jgi:hypothetical protein
LTLLIQIAGGLLGTWIERRNPRRTVRINAGATTLLLTTLWLVTPRLAGGLIVTGIRALRRLWRRCFHRRYQ